LLLAPDVRARRAEEAGCRAEAALSEQEETAGHRSFPNEDPSARGLRRPRAVAAGARYPADHSPRCRPSASRPVGRLKLMLPHVA